MDFSQWFLRWRLLDLIFIWLVAAISNTGEYALVLLDARHQIKRILKFKFDSRKLGGRGLASVWLNVTRYFFFDVEGFNAIVFNRHGFYSENRWFNLALWAFFLVNSFKNFREPVRVQVVGGLDHTRYAKGLAILDRVDHRVLLGSRSLLPVHHGLKDFLAYFITVVLQTFYWLLIVDFLPFVKWGNVKVAMPDSLRNAYKLAALPCELNWLRLFAGLVALNICLHWQLDLYGLLLSLLLLLVDPWVNFTSNSEFLVDSEAAGWQVRRRQLLKADDLAHQACVRILDLIQVALLQVVPFIQLIDDRLGCFAPDHLFGFGFRLKRIHFWF